MPQNNSEQSSPILLWLVIGVIAFFVFQSMTAKKPVSPDPDKPDVVQPDVVRPDYYEVGKPSEMIVWNEIAICVEKNWIGGLTQQHTDHLVKVVDKLKESDLIKDDSRIKEWRTKRTDITSANRAEIAKRLRGI